MIELDTIDRRLLRELVHDATQPASTLGRKLGLLGSSPSELAKAEQCLWEIHDLHRCREWSGFETATSATRLE